MIGRYLIVLLLLMNFPTNGQEIQLLTVKDFDLVGPVKSCLVITDYGRELFEFDKQGYLIKTVTQYNETDQDITYFKYENDHLVEKRMESYKDNMLDASTSMVNFYARDSLQPQKLYEKIVSYDKEFLEQQEYEFDEENRLVKITTSNAEGVDESTVQYEPYKNELTTSYLHNGILEKSIRTSEKKTVQGYLKIELTKDFIDGEPNKACEKTVHDDGRLASEEYFAYNVSEKEFQSERKLIYEYDAEGILEKVTTKTANAVAVKEFIFQFDSNPEKNWIKKIVTPDNTYSTRRIAYYKPEEIEESQEPN
ncbi:hypothetical protein M3P19_06090 [Muricauda sp. 2012CJ35-5]|uniref:YD repeat-containing protein n=1 Tax=Flagellimonas spongiicola TaxID=2942208 RepID=A0ABT0PQA6_9FLAO|nr:hypothetical protein [Allomuricauda spongiicola]MCL6273572.1 hypothetical protein [Allomuricauda spongiicola]